MWLSRRTLRMGPRTQDEAIGPGRIQEVIYTDQVEEEKERVTPSSHALYTLRPPTTRSGQAG